MSAFAPWTFLRPGKSSRAENKIIIIEPASVHRPDQRWITSAASRGSHQRRTRHVTRTLSDFPMQLPHLAALADESRLVLALPATKVHLYRDLGKSLPTEVTGDSVIVPAAGRRYLSVSGLSASEVEIAFKGARML